jgi:hypothetical protein
MNRIIDYLSLKTRKMWHDQAAAAVLTTPPIKAKNDGVILFSMIGTRVLYPYLVAIKSLHHQLQRGRIVVLDDGSLTKADKKILKDHLDDPRIIAIESVDTGDCPVGGTWERLLTILDLRQDNYVIQLDSDTITTGAIPQITQAIEQNRSFTIKGGAESKLVSLNEASHHAKNSEYFSAANTHVQLAIEAAMDRVAISERPDLHYVRGCSGFTGFSASKMGRELAEAFSAEAIRLLGMERWSEWGSEQVTSNFVIANETDPLLLPYEHYCNFWNEPLSNDVRFIHFIGTFRYHKGLYTDTTRDVVQALIKESSDTPELMRA